MPLMPFQILGIWLRGLLAILLVGVGVFLLKYWYDHPKTIIEPIARAEARRGDRPAVRIDRGDERGAPREVVTARWQLGLDRETAGLTGGLLLILLSLGAGSMGYPLIRRAGGKTRDAADPAAPAPGLSVRRIQRPDGSELFAVALGKEDDPVIVMTHGWGVDSAEWAYSRDLLASDHRLILWDLPGLGRSSRPRDNDFSLERMARDLEAIIGLAGGRPVVLLGHSIGGMIGLTYARLFPEALGPRVRGLVFVHTTYTNPVKTTRNAALYSALQKPVLEPLCHLMIWLAPLVWVMNWLSYLNGSMQRSTDRSSFAGHETREQLNLVSWFGVKAWPGIVARGMLAMFRYDATPILATIPVPTLVIAGDRDETTCPGASETMARTIPHAHLDVLRPARHMGHMEQCDEFARAVGRFVSELSSSEAPRSVDAIVR